MIPGLFVTGTDTGVGKSRVAAAIASILKDSGRSVGVLKPVASGVEVRDDGSWSCEDAEVLGSAIGGNVDPARIAPLRLERPLAPSVAARLDGIGWDHGEITRIVLEARDWWADRAEILIVEGVGGLLCPLAEGSTLADLAIALDYPLIVVARRSLGTLNHTLLTAEAARIRGLRVAGVILNGSEPTASEEAEASNAEELSRRLGGVPVLADLPHQHGGSSLCDGLRSLDWYRRARPPRRG